MSENAVVSQEVAQNDFDRFVEMMGLDLNPEGMDENDRQDYIGYKALFLRSLQNGSLVLNDEGEPVYTPQRSDNTDPLTFHEFTGAMMLEMDRKKATADVAKGFALMAATTKTSVARFSSMKKNPDLNVCQAVLMLFLA